MTTRMPSTPFPSRVPAIAIAIAMRGQGGDYWDGGMLPWAGS